MVSLPPLVEPIAELSGQQLARASRHVILPGLGALGQRRLAAARVLVIGAGGLGSPTLQYLAAAGVGVIGIVDFDVVDLSNLQRQVIHRTSSIGERKTASAARSIAALNPLVSVVQHDVRLTRNNVVEIFDGYDLVVDGSDNFATRYLTSDAAALLGMPCVWGSVYQYDGQVTVFWANAPDDRGLDYRDLHPTPPTAGEVLSCDEAGVLGSVCASIGAMMATEAAKLITGIGEPLLGRVQILDALAGDWREVRVSRRQGREPVSELIDYDEFCGARQADEHEASGPGAAEAGTITASELLARGTEGLIDVREAYEHDIVHIEGDRLLPLAQLLEESSVVGAGPVVVYCATGVRSARAAEALRATGVDALSLRGGIRSWLELGALENQRT